MNTKPSSLFLANVLGVKELDKKICLKEVQSFQCCFDIKGPENCAEFLEFVECCYKNKGRNIRS